MPESSIVVRPEPMDSGSYTASTRLQAAGLQPAIALFEQAAAVVPLPSPPQPIVIADYGAATGHNSLMPVCAAIAVLRKRTRADHSVLVVHTDVPDNDFTAMFNTLTEDPDSYLQKDQAAFASAVGRSFYNQIVPSNSVHLGWSSWAIHWLSQVPQPVPDHVQVAYSADENARAAYARQAAHDWHEFVAYRGRELCKDGRMVVMTMAVDDDGEAGFRPLLGALTETLDELAAQSLVTAEELHRMSIPTVGRRKADFLAPFAPKGRFEQLEIEHLEVFDAEDRYWNSYQKDGDATAFGRQWATFCRASVFPALAAGLDGDETGHRTTELFDRLEAGLAARLAAAPEQMHIPMAHVVLVKRPKARS
ncbi:class I SAM-dependent methyltransferase [Mycobacterium sp. IDR2000157661]|uniref:class I SAM-dependent methyltransferase n=1 Tax=Mycobacterium sp. IDR2000157661 TaxID=2867005 RepID=UPI001EEC5792|nr:class I SAM-dependent methyltransferase [Mycobacterium sp. IDR2000157661]ULE32009.1 class I SAM-dependent methyltransferase [Mycobacterium sp. IDR2000157661]